MVTKVLAHIRAGCLDSPERRKIMSWKVCMWKVLRHFCNNLILRDCEMPVSCFSCDISCIIFYAICLILYFMRYILYHASCDMSCIVFSCEKPVLYDSLATGHI